MINDAGVLPAQAQEIHLLFALYFLKDYQTEELNSIINPTFILILLIWHCVVLISFGKFILREGGREGWNCLHVIAPFHYRLYNLSWEISLLRLILLSYPPYSSSQEVIITIFCIKFDKGDEKNKFAKNKKIIWRQWWNVKKDRKREKNKWIWCLL